MSYTILTGCFEQGTEERGAGGSSRRLPSSVYSVPNTLCTILISIFTGTILHTNTATVFAAITIRKSSVCSRNFWSTILQ